MNRFVWSPVTLVMLCSLSTASEPKQYDNAFSLWQAIKTTPELRVCAGLDKEGNLRLVNYDEIHMQPSSPTANDGGLKLTRTFETKSFQDATVRSVGGKKLASEQFQAIFEEGKANASRLVGREKVYEHHTLILLIENGRPTPDYYPMIFRSDIPVVTLPRRSIMPEKVRKTIRNQDGIPVP
ncbi:MAG: hypothetical protein AAFX06_20145 [Planctomycetota bacterium]